MPFKLPNDLETALTSRAKLRGVSVDMALQEILQQALQVTPPMTDTTSSEHLWVGIGESEITDLSERVDELMFTPMVWVFNALTARFASGIFYTRENAEAWIKRHSLTGILTEYPVGEGVLDWAVRKAYFKPKPELAASPRYVGQFTSVEQEHFHYENGDKIG